VVLPPYIRLIIDIIAPCGPSAKYSTKNDDMLGFDLPKLSKVDMI